MIAGFPPPFGDFPPWDLLVQVVRRVSTGGVEFVLLGAHGLRCFIVRSAYCTQHLDISLYNMSLFRSTLEVRLQMKPRENERWIEIVASAKNIK